MKRPFAQRGAVAVLVALVACTDRSAASGQWVRPGVVVMRDVGRVGALENKRLSEASGIVASVAQPGRFWVLNDSGNDAELFAIDSAGRALGTVRIRGAKNRDWEALASGPCPEGSCLFIGDTGDNMGSRSNLAIHRLPEPKVNGGEVTVAATLALAYSDGPHDVEAMYAAPDGSLWLVTKRPERGDDGAARPSRMYLVPPAAWQQQTARYVAQIVDSVPVVPEVGDSRDFITDASLSPPLPNGTRRVVLLSYGAVHVFEADAVSGRPLSRVARCALPIAERTAEAVSWLSDGRILLLNEGKRTPLYTGRCP